jgi:hypothetical protein
MLSKNLKKFYQAQYRRQEHYSVAQPALFTGESCMRAFLDNFPSAGYCSGELRVLLLVFQQDKEKTLG